MEICQKLEDENLDEKFSAEMDFGRIGAGAVLIRLIRFLLEVHGLLLRRSEVADELVDVLRLVVA